MVERLETETETHMLKRTLLAAVGALSLASGAHAYTLTTSLTDTPWGNESAFDPFVGQHSGSFITSLGTWTFQGNTSGVYATEVFPAGLNVPNYEISPDTTGAYVAAVGGMHLDLSEASSQIQFMWGSPEPNGSGGPGGLGYDVFCAGAICINSGSIAAMVPPNQYGVLVTITGLPLFSQAEWTTNWVNPYNGHIENQRAFEFNDVAVTPGTGAAPELSTWAMLGLGFAGLGYAGYRRQHTPRLAAIV